MNAYRSLIVLLKLLIVAELFLSLKAHAGAHCVGTLNYPGISQVGDVNVALAGASGIPIHSICSTLSKGVFHTDPVACKGVYATLLAARLGGNTVGFYYEGATPAGCSAITSWSQQPSFYFLELP